MRKLVVFVGGAAVAIGYAVLLSRVHGLSSDVRALQREVANVRSEARARVQDSSGPQPSVVRTPAPTDLITVITGGRSERNANIEDQWWPACNFADSVCVDRILAPCDEVQLAYSTAHMGTQTFFPPFTAHRGAMIDSTGKPLSPRDIFDMAKKEGLKIEGGKYALEQARNGDRTPLVGFYTERGEIDVFVSGRLGLDEAKCTDRESRFQVIDGPLPYD